MRPEVRAAGGVVWRRGGRGELEVLVVHRPAYGDWTLPKGKALEGETDEACALREVAEETGLACELGPELPATAYDDSLGRAKRVRYWAMRPVSGAFEPHAEVDEARWAKLGEAAALLTFARDRDVVGALEAALSG